MRIKFTRFLVNIPYLIRTQKYKSLKITDEKIGGVPVRIYQPEMRKNRKCIIYIHGGGWCIMQPGMIVSSLIYSPYLLINH